MTLDEKLDLAEKKLNYAEDYREIYNVVSLQTLYLRVQRQAEAFEACWSKREDIEYGAAKGREAVYRFLVTRTDEEKAEKLRIANKYYGVDISPENSGVGDLDSVGMASPYIVIAEDRQTAQGVFFALEVKSQLGADGKLHARYIQERVGVDFIREDGDWKIWHWQIYPDFTCALPEEIFDDNRYTGRTFDVDEQHSDHKNEADRPRDPEHAPDSERPRGRAMEPYSPRKVPVFNPPIPTSYAAWSEEETLPIG